VIEAKNGGDVEFDKGIVGNGDLIEATQGSSVASTAFSSTTPVA